MEDTIVLYPSPAIGHLISMVGLGKLILTQKPSLPINILVTPPPSKVGGPITQYINHISTTIPLITFHHLPTITPPPTPNSSLHVKILMLDVLRHNNPNVHQTLVSISKSYNIQALVIDLFCAPALAVAEKLDIPTFYFFTSGASCLASFLYYPTIHHNTTKSLRELDCDLDFPGLPPVPAKEMPTTILERNDQAYEYFLDFSRKIPKSKGVIINTFDILEARALKAISEGLCVPNGPTPPTYCIGPLIAANCNDKRENGGSDECLTWLNSQPSKSVVFLCFGSLGLFSLQQLKEIAIGLEKSEKRFLWVVRKPQGEHGKNSHFVEKVDPDLDSLLPNGFLDRTKGRGLVVYEWAPQVEVLSHKSIGGFVTHCGWNSVLEAICNGVPMVAWPLYAEQKLNRIVMVEELKIAIPMEESKDELVIGSEEVQKQVRELMDSTKGASVRKQTMIMKEEAKKALSEGGSSRIALNKLVDSWRGI